MMFSRFTPQRMASSAHEIADAPAPEITSRTSLCFFPTIARALANPAEEMIAVPCWSSWNTGMSSIFLSSSSM
ncbi:hypothetical protein D3C83_60410 [compost metagenome]